MPLSASVWWQCPRVLMHHIADDQAAHTAAQAVVADPAITVRRRRVLSGEWPAVLADLDELPDGSIIVWNDEDDHCVAIKSVTAAGSLAWFEAGYQRPIAVETLAGHCVPFEVLA